MFSRRMDKMGRTVAKSRANLLSWLLVCGGCASFVGLQEWSFRRAAAPFYQLGGYVQASGDGMDRISGAAGVNFVNLSDTNVRDDDLARLRLHMEGLTNLRMLSLQNTKITDAGLEHLKGMKQLRTLNLSGTPVTDEGVHSLKEALPASAVFYHFEAQ